METNDISTANSICVAGRPPRLDAFPQFLWCGTIKRLNKIDICTMGECFRPNIPSSNLVATVLKADQVTSQAGMLTALALFHEYFTEEPIN